MGKGIYYFGGSAVFRLSYLFLLKNILFEIKSIVYVIGSQIKELIFLLFRQSFVSVAGCCVKPSR